jgi:ketosteroid isomerase-like protein
LLRDETGIVVQESNNVAGGKGPCEYLDVKTLVLLVAVLSGPVFASDCPKNQPKTEAALLELEHHWADALTHKDADAVSCILADEFEDADVDGSLHSRAEALAHIPQRKPWTNRLTEMRTYVDGNSGFARGLNEILDADGKVVARVRFTDIFTYRDSRWQALAGQETLVGEAHR